MEKYIIFGPIILMFGFMGLLTLIFFLFVAKLIFKAKSDSWVGEVIDKNRVLKDKDDGPGKETFLSIKVRLKNGEIHNIATSSQLYNEVKIGDTLKKEKGSFWPKKIT